MDAEAGGRLYDHLPAVFRAADESGDLARLLGAFEAYFLTGSDLAQPPLAGIEAGLRAIPALFAPLEDGGCGRTPDRFLPWLAGWLGFAPHAGFAPDALRRVCADIVPWYGRRGTRDYLVWLLGACFDGEVAGIEVDDRPLAGFTIGASLLGTDTRLAHTRPFWFRVVIDLDDAPAGAAAPNRGTLERRLREVIDFAKPAHTSYELQWRRQPRKVGDAAADDASPAGM